MAIPAPLKRTVQDLAGHWGGIKPLSAAHWSETSHGPSQLVDCAPAEREGLTVLLEGVAGRYVRFADGRRQIVAYLLPGDICHFGETQSATTSPLSSLTPIRVARMTMIASAVFAGSHMALLQHRMRETEIAHQWIANVGARTALERTAHLFCELLVRLSTVGLASEGTYSLPLTQSHLADALALSAVHLNRTLMSLKHQGLVTFQHRVATIHDYGALADVAGFSPEYLKLSSH